MKHCTQHWHNTMVNAASPSKPTDISAQPTSLQQYKPTFQIPIRKDSSTADRLDDLHVIYTRDILFEGPSGEFKSHGCKNNRTYFALISFFGNTTSKKGNKSFLVWVEFKPPGMKLAGDPDQIRTYSVWLKDYYHRPSLPPCLVHLEFLAQVVLNFCQSMNFIQ